ncbi:unnamed protein product [Meganyctiphanes norvegica]|uniref:Reelin domain-containing protein n=1 Tax=Meganyctiphanes norvegica TaxID=48144 RepID=A0AAV2QHK8_MEGNR
MKNAARANRLSCESFGLAVVLAVLALVLNQLDAYPDGAPVSSCKYWSPWHEPYTEPVSSIPPYSIKTYMDVVRPNALVPVCLFGQEPFKGFMLQAITTDGDVVGTFELRDQDKGRVQLMNCSTMGTMDTVCHTEKNHKKVQSFRWRAPTDYEGQIVFRAVIVRNYSIFWRNLESLPFQIKLDVDN